MSKTEEQIRSEEAILRGLRLSDVIRTPGWSDVLDIMDSVVAEAVNDLVKEDAAEPTKILALHAQAKAARVNRDLVVYRINVAIAAAQHEKSVQEQKLNQDF